MPYVGPISHTGGRVPSVGANQRVETWGLRQAWQYPYNVQGSPLAGRGIKGKVCRAGTRPVDPARSRLPVLEKEWGLSQAALGLVNSAFFLIYSALQVPGGALGDRIGRKRVLVGSSLLHGLGTLVSGTAWGYAPFLAARALAGLGQSAYYATQYAIASIVLPPAVTSPQVVEFRFLPV